MNRSLTLFAAALAAASLAAPSAHALEPFKTYDNFGTATIDPALWNDGERARAIKRGALNLMQRSSGAATADTGATFISFDEHVSNPAAVTELKAKITVNALEVNACVANTALGQSRARIVGSFDNIGVPVPGSEVGDSLAQVRLTRFSNSTEAPGVLRVQGLLAKCTKVDCTSSNLVGNIVDLGTINVGQSATVELQWDKPGKAFLFSRDAGAFSGSVGYIDSDAQPPGQPFKSLSTRMDLPSCLTGPRVTGLVDANFDNVSVNRSAAP